MSARSHGGGGGLLGTLGAPRRSWGPSWGRRGGGVGPGDPPCTAGRAQRCVLCARLCAGSLEGSGHLGVPPGAGGAPAGCCPVPPGAPGRAGTPSVPFQERFADLASAAAEGLPVPSASPALGILGLPPSQGLPGARHPACGVPGCAPVKRAPAGSPSPPSFPSLSPPGTLKVLKVKYYRLLCCCLTTTDKLRTSCQNVSAQQINIQNESQRYVVYN